VHGVYSIPMYRCMGVSSRREWLNCQLEDVRCGREAPTFVFSGIYAVARRRHPPMMLILLPCDTVASDSAMGGVSK
jgi:hypothetical protein